MEPLLARVLLALFGSGLLSDGDVMDAGANDGKDSRWLAEELFPRTMLAMDPIRRNVQSIRNKTSGYFNTQVLHGALGAAHGTGHYNPSLDSDLRANFRQIGKHSHWGGRGNNEGEARFQIFTVDELFEGRALAFAHWDLEGAEPDMLVGAAKTISRHRPYFTVESHPETASQVHTRLMAALLEMGYQAFQVPEKCGITDCRNFVCVPKEKLGQFKSTMPQSLFGSYLREGATEGLEVLEDLPCEPWGCTCQGFSDRFGTGKGAWAAAAKDHSAPQLKQWWIAKKCKTAPMR